PGQLLTLHLAVRHDAEPAAREQRLELSSGRFEKVVADEYVIGPRAERHMHLHWLSDHAQRPPPRSCATGARAARRSLRSQRGPAVRRAKARLRPPLRKRGSVDPSACGVSREGWLS